MGLAQMTSQVEYRVNFNYWSQNDKWKGFFFINWVFIKDIPNKVFRSIINEYNDNKPVTSSRDTQEIFPLAGIEMYKIFKEYPTKSSIFDLMSPEEKVLMFQKGQLSKMQSTVQTQIQNQLKLQIQNETNHEKGKNKEQPKNPYSSRQFRQKHPQQMGMMNMPNPGKNQNMNSMLFMQQQNQMNQMKYQMGGNQMNPQMNQGGMNFNNQKMNQMKYNQKNKRNNNKGNNNYNQMQMQGQGQGQKRFNPNNPQNTPGSKLMKQQIFNNPQQIFNDPMREQGKFGGNIGQQGMNFGGNIKGSENDENEEGILEDKMIGSNQESNILNMMNNNNKSEKSKLVGEVGDIENNLGLDGFEDEHQDKFFNSKSSSQSS